MRNRRYRGLTMIETSLLVSLSGIGLAVAVPTFLRALQTSKVSEAGTQLSRMVSGAQTYYDAFRDLDGMHRTHCLPPLAGPVPQQPSAAGVTVNMAVYPEASATFSALGFELPSPTHYRYSFLPSESGCGLGEHMPQVTARFLAEGDLDGDGVLSRFTRLATAAPTQLEVDPLLMVERRVE